MLIISLILGIVVISWSSYFGKDLASGVVGFIYGGVFVFLIRIIILIIRNIR